MIKDFKQQVVLVVLWITTLSLLTSCGKAVENVAGTGTPAVTVVAAVTETATMTQTPRPNNTPTQTATVRPTPTHTPTITPTSTFKPLTSHNWDSGPVIAQLDNGVCIDVCIGEVFSPLPQWILYADGRLLINHYNQGIREYRLSSSEICAFLNTVDQIGFWKYDDSEYREQRQAFPGLIAPYIMRVSGWQSNTIEAGGLQNFLEGGSGEGEIKISPTLAQAYLLFQEFSDYSQGGSIPYVPENVAVEILVVQKEEQIDGAYEKGEWPLATPTLAELAEQTDEHGHLVVNGTTATEIFALFDQQFEPGWHRYDEGNQNYLVAVRPLLPYETSGGEGNHVAPIPSPDLIVATTAFSCTPADGTLSDLFIEPTVRPTISIDEQP